MLGRYRYAYLLATLILLILGRPFLPDFGKNFVIAMLALSLMTAAVTSASKQYQAWVGVVMTCLIVFCSLAPDDFMGLNTAVVVPFMGVAYWSFTGVLILRRVAEGNEGITGDTINGAVCVYLMMGLGWSHAYALLEALAPGSYTITPEMTQIVGHSFERFIGFSFVTLTTLGYGNVVPLTPRAEAVATAEAVAGQLYLAVLLARFVAIDIVSRRD
ncbi:MAG: ion channel [Myxococcota bacterium]|nr:ion channel [Myxococcota bacterium]